MCIAQPRPPAPDPAIEAERQERMRAETEQRRRNRDERVEEMASKRKRGTGIRSLLTGQSGGIGFYNQYRDM